MPLQIDSSRALRTHDQLVTLVRAIVAAAPEDESRAVEWKSSYPDLTSSEASFAIARAILGLSNRSVRVASTAFEGVGYVVIGAEPGRLAGQAIPDSAEILNAVRRYTGHGAPLWDPRPVSVDGSNVLVITVEPPRDGDRIALLHKSYQGSGKLVPEGTIFVRQSGATERASRAELEYLQDRLVAGQSGSDALVKAGRHDRIRELVATAADAAQRWTDTMQILTIASASAEKMNWIDWANSESGKQMAQDVRAMKNSARQLRLLVDAPALLPPLAEAVNLIEHPEPFDAIHNQPSTPESRTTAYRHINAIKQAWASVETAAIELFAH